MDGTITSSPHSKTAGYSPISEMFRTRTVCGRLIEESGLKTIKGRYVTRSFPNNHSRNARNLSEIL